MSLKEHIGELILAHPGRIVTSGLTGAALDIPSDYSFGEAIELRYTSSLSNKQFQGIYCEVRTLVANTSTIRGAEFKAARDAAVAVGVLEGVNAAAFVRVNGGGNVTNVFGATGEVQVASGYTGTLTLVAGLRGKVQTEDGSTVTEGYGCLVENEFVTGGVVLTAAFGAKATGAGIGFGVGIDLSGTKLTVHDTDQVTLIKFKNSSGTNVTMSYDVSTSALAFA